MEITRTQLEPNHVEEILEIARRAQEEDGVAPLSEQFLVGLDDATLKHSHLVAQQAGRIIGVAAVDAGKPQTAELVVDPQFRREGAGSALLKELGDTPVWAHGDLPEAQELARATGRSAGRTLLVMEIKDPDLADVTEVAELPENYFLTDLTQAEQRWDVAWVLDQWLGANNEAFDWHPEQGGWDHERLERALHAPWFRATDVLFLWHFDSDGAPHLAGFHWTKWHTTDVTEGTGYGEVYVIGLASDFRGKQLGDPLLRAGLHHLYQRGARKIILYVEDDNEPAVKAYKRLGFEVAEKHVVYEVSDAAKDADKE
ncbi:MshD acetyltransferase [Corynebacterium renale]|uniref:mycothiol synthase n=1 Tax=Corynebacterium renale TaxID=1724 RepID=UPI000DA34D83|nr:mycothiol synthase [Corynebacterium renale]SQG65338.1 MshD acetyltransferase [Corynebacterium renale]STC98736.1 MshD acetyltransferase [Corynebacterium renale]